MILPFQVFFGNIFKIARRILCSLGEAFSYVTQSHASSSDSKFSGRVLLVLLEPAAVWRLDILLCSNGMLASYEEHFIAQYILSSSKNN